MMKKINILGQDISSKIAAGEVIERPVSVVKELVENSIDAGSKNIIVEIKKGGKESIRVIDDGEGISREDVKIAFERHATSKIYNIDDIFNINTLGFRGEALASIAAVSNISMITKTQKDSVGTLCKISGGVIEEFDDKPANNGCIIEVMDLFFNTPARLKFLSNDTHETSRITDLITRFAIGNIGISFRLINDGKELFYSAGNGDYREVIAKIYGVELARQAIPIEKAFESGKIRGYISKPNFNRGNRTGQTFFVNGRFVKDSGLTFCLERAFKTMIPVKRFPIAIIFIDIDNSQVDVNVHPSKMEIKFQNENQVHQTLFQVVSDSLKEHVLIPNETFDTPYINNPNRTDTQTQLKLNSDVLPKNEYYSNNNSKIYAEATATKEFIKESPIIDKQKYLNKNNHIDVKPRKETEIVKKSEGPKDISQKLKFQRIVGQLFNTYIVVEGKKQFYLIDQHAAHERILYEFYSNRYTKPLDSQSLIAPYVLHLSAQEMMLIENYKEDILKMGFDFSIFGNDSILVRTVPYIFNKPIDPITLRDIIDQINSNDYAEYPTKERLIISMSCHAAIKAGDILSPIEIQELIDQLKRTVGPYTCPHGRPTIIAMTLNELEKKFKRT
jgi:DNA mismatch repair protein MutL